MYSYVKHDIVMLFMFHLHGTVRASTVYANFNIVLSDHMFILLTVIGFVRLSHY
jgi:hypothetical protein